MYLDSIISVSNSTRLERIFLFYTYLEEEAKTLKPKIVFVDEKNKIVEQVDKEIHGEIK